jgi:hypothetical protein
MEILSLWCCRQGPKLQPETKLRQAILAEKRGVISQVRTGRICDEASQAHIEAVGVRDAKGLSRYQQVGFVECRPCLPQRGVDIELTIAVEVGALAYCKRRSLPGSLDLGVATVLGE